MDNGECNLGTPNTRTGYKFSDEFNTSFRRSFLRCWYALRRRSTLTQVDNPAKDGTTLWTVILTRILNKRTRIQTMYTILQVMWSQRFSF